MGCFWEFLGNCYVFGTIWLVVNVAFTIILTIVAFIFINGGRSTKEWDSVLIGASVLVLAVGFCLSFGWVTILEYFI